MIISCSSKSGYTTSIESDGSVTVKNNSYPIETNIKFDFKELFSIKNISFKNAEGGPDIFVVSDDDKNTFVYNYRNNKILKYNCYGKVINKFAGTGYGPGEITYASNLNLYQDTIQVYNGNNKQFSFYNLDGEFIKHVLLDDEYKESFPRWFDADKFIIIEQTFTLLEKNSFLRYTSYANDSNWCHELAILVKKNDTVIKKVIFESMLKHTKDIFATTWLKHTVRDGKIYYAENSQDFFMFYRISDIGSKELTVTKKYIKVKYPLAIKAMVKLVNPNFFERSLNYVQAISDIKADKYGNIWIRSYADQINPKSENVFHVFDKFGIYVKRIDLSKNTDLEVIENLFFKKDMCYIYASKSKNSECELYVFNY